MKIWNLEAIQIVVVVVVVVGRDSSFFYLLGTNLNLPLFRINEALDVVKTRMTVFY